MRQVYGQLQLKNKELQSTRVTGLCNDQIYAILQQFMQ
jgi:hypothetical protein